MSSERRSTPRYPSWLEGAVFSPASDDHGVSVRVTDLSLGGASVEGDLVAPAGTRLRIKVEWDDHEFRAGCIAAGTASTGPVSVNPTALHRGEPRGANTARE